MKGKIRTLASYKHKAKTSTLWDNYPFGIVVNKKIKMAPSIDNRHTKFNLNCCNKQPIFERAKADTEPLRADRVLHLVLPLIKAHSRGRTKSGSPSAPCGSVSDLVRENSCLFIQFHNHTL